MIRVLGVYRKDEVNSVYNAALAITIPEKTIINSIEAPSTAKDISEVGS